MLVRKALPAIVVRRVIFTDGRPLPFAQVWAPALPILQALGILIEPAIFGDHLHNAIPPSRGPFFGDLTVVDVCPRRVPTENPPVLVPQGLVVDVTPAVS